MTDIVRNGPAQAAADAWADPGGPDRPVTAVPREGHEGILVGHGGPLVVPREDLGSGIDGGQDLDFGADQTPKVRRPGRPEWFSLDPSRALETRLLPRRVGPDGLQTEYYYVDRSIRGPIREEIRDVVIYPFWSHTAGSPGLWVVGVNVGNSWYESLVPLFQRPADFYARHAFRLMSDRPAGRYRIKYKDVPGPARWPDRPTDVLLGEALGPGRFIMRPDHLVYRELIEGFDLD